MRYFTLSNSFALGLNSFEKNESREKQKFIIKPQAFYNLQLQRSIKGLPYETGRVLELQRKT